MSTKQNLSTINHYFNRFTEFVKDITGHRTNTSSTQTRLSTWIKRIFIITIIIYCISSFRPLTTYMNRTTNYVLKNTSIPIFNNKTKNMTDTIVQTSFHRTTLELSHIYPKEFSSEYKETPPILVMNSTIRKYITEEIYFALTSNTKRIRTTIHYLKFWANHPGIKCLIVFEEKDLMNNRNITEYLTDEGLSCKIQSSNITRFEERYFDLFHLAWTNQEMNYISNQTKTIQWFAVGDDDTVWFINNLLRTLQQYNSSNLMYVGDVSDRKSQVLLHGGYYAYGGGGVLLSRPLALLFSQHTQECKQSFNIFPGDAMIGKCVTQVLKVTLTKNNHFLQMDYRGDITGYLESGIDGLVSLHHMFSLWKPFPDLHTNKMNETMYLLQLAYNTFDEMFLKRYVRINRKTNQTLLLTMGYSYSIFNRILSPKDLIQVENTWNGNEMTARKSRAKENNKMTWFFKRLTNESFNGSTGYRTVYENGQNMNNGTISTIEVIVTN